MSTEIEKSRTWAQIVNPNVASTRNVPTPASDDDNGSPRSEQRASKFSSSRSEVRSRDDRGEGERRGSFTRGGGRGRGFSRRGGRGRGRRGGRGRGFSRGDRGGQGRGFGRSSEPRQPRSENYEKAFQEAYQMTLDEVKLPKNWFVNEVDSARYMMGRNGPTTEWTQTMYGLRKAKFFMEEKKKRERSKTSSRTEFAGDDRIKIQYELPVEEEKTAAEPDSSSAGARDDASSTSPKFEAFTFSRDKFYSSQQFGDDIYKYYKKFVPKLDIDVFTRGARYGGRPKTTIKVYLFNQPASLTEADEYMDFGDLIVSQMKKLDEQEDVDKAVKEVADTNTTE